MDTLTEREEAILDILVTTYASTGRPVGSRTISRSGLGLSAATIRNSMGDLEEKGYLRQPHTSAGRVPSDKGYRYYVAKLMAQEELSEAACQLIRESIETRIREGNIEGVLEQVSRVIAEISKNIGVVLAPRFERGTFRSLEMLPLTESKLLVVLTIRSGLVKTMVIEVDSTISSSELVDTKRVINERLSGLTVGEIRRTVGDRLRSAYGSPKLLRLICDSAATLFKLHSVEDLHFGGAGNIFLQPEFVGNQQAVASLLGLFEQREPIVTILDERMDREGITVTIGDEHATPELHSCSVVTSCYRLGNTPGVIGIIGPTRLPYARIVPLIQYVADVTGEILDQQ